MFEETVDSRLETVDRRTIVGARFPRPKHGLNNNKKDMQWKIKCYDMIQNI